jgi:2-C-methyl-D-erythritol 4-phosphate cytidylyltransferase
VRAVAILTAAGAGARLGHTLPKALVELDGQPLVARAAMALLDGGAVGHLVVTAPSQWDGIIEAAVRAVAGDVPVDVVRGGATRQQSVAVGLARLGSLGFGSGTVVLVHDAARPLVPAVVVERVIAAVESGHGAVVPGLPVVDTVKQVDDGADGIASVRATVDRRTLRAVQTPQGFSYDLLVRAHRAGGGDDEATAATDDAALVEALGEPVWVVEGHADALKITTTRDLLLAEALLEARR